MNVDSGKRAADEPPEPRNLFLSTLLKRAVINAAGQEVGRPDDVVVRVQGADSPLAVGLVANLQGRRVFVHSEDITAWHTDLLELASAKVDLRLFERRPGEMLLRADVLGHRLVDVENARLVRASDILLTWSEGGWHVSHVDVRRAARLRLFGRGDNRVLRDWNEFALVGERVPLMPRSRRAWLSLLKPAEIADLLEEASDQERQDILAQVEGDLELEADIFEELEDDEQSELFGLRADNEVAEVLSRMQADDAADAIMQLPTERRESILEWLPAGQRTKVMMLLGFHAASAGGLMGVDYVALPAEATVKECLAAIGRATGIQSQSLTSVHMIGEQGELAGVATLVALLQADPSTALGAVAELDPITVDASADLVTLTLLMADHNLLTLPVVDGQGIMIGVITVDDVLEASVPDNWRRRVPEPRHRSGDAD
jgi:CBS domain-containing protein